MERELQEKAQAQQQLEQQQQLLKARSASASTPTAVRQAEETAKRVMELNAAAAAAGATGVQRGLAESLCLTGTPAMESLPLKDLVVQLPKLLTNPDLAAATQSLIPNPAYTTTEPFLQNSTNPTPFSAHSSSVVSSGVSVAHQVQPPSPQFLQQPVPSAVVTNGSIAGGNSTGKASKGRSNSGKTPRTNKTSQQQPPLPPPPPQQQQQQTPVSSQQPAQPISPQAAPLALNLQTEHNGGEDYRPSCHLDAHWSIGSAYSLRIDQKKEIAYPVTVKIVKLNIDCRDIYIYQKIFCEAFRLFFILTNWGRWCGWLCLHLART